MPAKPMLSAEAVLRWYLAAGVDEAILEQPVNRRLPAPERPGGWPASAGPASAADRSPPPAGPVRQPPAPSASPATVPSAPPALAPGPASAAVPAPAAVSPAAVSPAAAAPASPGFPLAADPQVADAYAQARQARSLDELRAILAAFDGCPLRRTATNLVFGDGSPQARVVFIGEAPGAEEDRRGLPFVGPSGRLLDRMLASIGLDRSQVYISNTLFWRPPGNRTPTPSEVAVCLPFVIRLLELIAPNLLVTLGGPAAAALLGRTESVGRLRGRWFEFRSDALQNPIPATAIFHPAYLLRTPAQKRSAWRDLIAIKRRLTVP